MKIAQRALQICPSLTLELTARAKQLKSEGMDVVSFGAGEPDFNTPDYILDAAKEALDNGVTKYTPASGTNELKQVICNKFLRDNGLEYFPSNIVVSNGAKHSLTNVCQAIVEEGDEVIIPAPYWLTYPELVRLSGGVPVTVNTKEENGFKMTAEELKNAITPKTKAVILNNPNNPTGAVYSKEEIYALAEVIEKTDIVVISDEIYEELNYTGEKVTSIATYSHKLKEQTIIVNGVSKTYAMTGWRIGFIAAPNPVAKAIANMQSHTTSNPNSIAQYATVAAYTHDGGTQFLKDMTQSFARRRKLIMDELNKIEQISYVRPDGAFYVLVNVSNVFGKKYEGTYVSTAHEFANLLLEKALVTVIPCESFAAPEYVRLSYAISDEDIKKGVGRIGAFVRAMEN
ncbi:MAG: pyridoxal phosphate-dependent aminotransferase [Clostridia bacterium]|nr:pyridoxal phosphate-dependent aminotransferase [Clostridia bacterium]MBR6773137.1 pyridoxal phosphate-dependent aminotransferase [Clostridia bacterium]